MRLKLAKSLAFGMSTSHVAISEGDATLDEVVKKIFDFNLTSLDCLHKSERISELERAVEAIRRVNLFTSSALALSDRCADARQKFPLFGAPTHASVDVHQMLIAVLMMGEVMLNCRLNQAIHEKSFRQRVMPNNAAQRQLPSPVPISCFCASCDIVFRWLRRLRTPMTIRRPSRALRRLL